MKKKRTMEDQEKQIVDIRDDAVQTLFVPVAPGRDVMVCMVALHRDPETGRHQATRPYLDDIEAAALAVVGRNWMLEREDDEQ